jgi:23S rRNA (uracil1939-C5)-methyltransferase
VSARAAEVELTVEKLVAGGEGIAFREGKAVFVPGVLPGERVRARIVERRRDYERAELLEVLSASADRVAPPCRLAGRCGGCDWLHIRHAAQLSLKRELAAEALRRIGGISLLPEITGGAPLAYRNRVQVHRDTRGRPGFMAAGSNAVVAVQTCPVAAPELAGVFSGAVPLPGRRRFTAFGARGLLSVEGGGGAQELSVTVAGREIAFPVGSFFQSNLELLEELVPFAREGLSGDTAADLYCGVGLFAAHLAPRFERVLCVERDARALDCARRNVPAGKGEFHELSVEDWILGPGSAQVPDAVVVDPPRTGLSAEARAFLSGGTASRLSYVSCNPVTLARDLSALLRGGWRLDDMRLFDFYPQTSHVEAVARLSRPAAGEARP